MANTAASPSGSLSPDATSMADCVVGVAPPLPADERSDAAPSSGDGCAACASLQAELDEETVAATKSKYKVKNDDHKEETSIRRARSTY